MSQSPSLLERQQHGTNADHQAKRDDRDEDGADGCPGFVVGLGEFRMDLGREEWIRPGRKDGSWHNGRSADFQLAPSAGQKQGCHETISRRKGVN